MSSFEYNLISFVLLQSDPVPVSPAPVTRDADLFDILKGNRIMTAINSELVPIMIAGEGPDFYDKNTTEKDPSRKNEWHAVLVTFC